MWPHTFTRILFSNPRGTSLSKVFKVVSRGVERRMSARASADARDAQSMPRMNLTLQSCMDKEVYQKIRKRRFPAPAFGARSPMPVSKPGPRRRISALCVSARRIERDMTRAAATFGVLSILGIYARHSPSFRHTRMPKRARQPLCHG